MPVAFRHISTRIYFSFRIFFETKDFSFQAVREQRFSTELHIIVSPPENVKE